MTDKIKASIPSHYTEEEKVEIIRLINDLAQIHIDLENQENQT